MKILLLGATGRTGKLVLSQALERGFQVNAIVRDQSKVEISNTQLVLFEGSPADPELLGTAIQNCEAVVNTLNISRTSDFPWAKLRTPKTFLSNLAKDLILVMERENVKRIVFTTAWGVADTLHDIPFFFRLLLQNSNIVYAYRDHERQEKLFEASTLDWTAVRPVGLSKSAKKKQLIISENNDPKPAMLISRRRLAKFLLDCISERSYIRQYPVISEK